MELYNLKFSDNTRLNVIDIDDYNVKGSFDPAASSDIEFFGFRETTFKVSCVESVYRTDNRWWPMTDEMAEEFAHYYDDEITLIVQNAIDDKQGEL